jgi:DNA-binding winged helix-turn-helix (wHTH) protein/Tol biopolymer transport system component
VIDSGLAGARGCGVAVSPAQDVVCFGLFELDLKAGQLSRNGTKLRLPQQPLQLLAVLLERPGETLTREELRQRLWTADVFVDFDHGLNKSIQKLRDALGDSATSPRYIETVPRVGYRFIAPVRNGIAPLPPQVEVKIERSIVAPVATQVVGNRSVRRWAIAAGLCAVCLLTGVAVYLASRVRPVAVKYTQLTDFTDSAATPALSPDGHMLAFIRGDSNFMSADPIYVKILPDGEARRLTNDPRLKYNLAFSPDGSQIAYTVMESPSFATYTVSVLGGDSHLLLKNAAGLTWLDRNHLLFSRTRSGLHLGVVTQTVSGDNFRELYFPPHERAMAHYSYASPDRRSAVVVEMNGQGNWAPCQLISLDDRSPAKTVGPEGGCTAAGWAPDGSWMYFIATLEGQSHLWRQRFPDGQPEQITFGPTNEEGLAVDREGRSVITSIGVRESAIWIHDAQGERSLSSEGEIVADLSPPSFGPDHQTLYYLLRHPPAGSDPELWRLAVDSGKNDAVFPGISMFAYDVSPDGKQVVYATAGHDGKSQLWIAPLDRSSPPKQIGQPGETTPYFGPRGKILFEITEGNANYLEQMNEDGSGRSKVVPYPIIGINGISPGRRWLMATAPYPEGKSVVPMELAISLDGGPPRRVCASYCLPTWSSSGKFLFLAVEAPSQTSPGRSLAIPVGPGESLPELPAGGIEPGAEPGIVPGSQSVNRAPIVPGADLAHFAYVNTTAHRNLYRISLP